MFQNLFDGKLGHIDPARWPVRQAEGLQTLSRTSPILFSDFALPSGDFWFLCNLKILLNRHPNPEFVLGKRNIIHELLRHAGRFLPVHGGLQWIFLPRTAMQGNLMMIPLSKLGGMAATMTLWPVARQDTRKRVFIHRIN